MASTGAMCTDFGLEHGAEFYNCTIVQHNNVGSDPFFYPCFEPIFPQPHVFITPPPHQFLHPAPLANTPLPLLPLLGCIQS